MDADLAALLADEASAAEAATASDHDFNTRATATDGGAAAGTEAATTPRQLYKWDGLIGDVGASDVHRIFDVFIVVGLQASTPSVFFRFDAAEEHREDKTYANLAHFCYPSSNVGRCKALEPEYFTFMLTNPVGGRRIGFCLRYLPEGSGSRYPEVMCVVGKFPWFSFYGELLRRLQDRPPRLTVEFLRLLLGQPFPAAGQTLSVPLAAGGPKAPPTVVRLTRPDDNDDPLTDITLQPLLQALGCMDVLIIFGALLQESRIILLSERLGVLSACAHAVTSLVHPFNWQHVFIPILPVKLLYLVGAPMPFVVGLHRDLEAEMNGLSLEEVVVVDLDAGTVRDVSGGGVVLSTEIVELLRATRGTCFPDELSALDDEAAAACFRSVFLAAFARHPLCIELPAELDGFALDDVHESGGAFPHTPSDALAPAPAEAPAPAPPLVATWDDAAFEATLPPKLAAWFQEFSRSQLFETWQDARLAAAAMRDGGAQGRSAFDRECNELLANVATFERAETGVAPGPFSSGALERGESLRAALLLPPKAPSFLGRLWGTGT